MTYFISVCFPSVVNLKQIEEKTALGRSGVCSPGKIMHGVMAFSMLFEQILIKVFAPYS